MTTAHHVMDIDTVSAGFGPLVGDYRGSDLTRAPLVLLHGLTMDRRVWTPVLEHLWTIDPSAASSRWTCPHTVSRRQPGRTTSRTWPTRSTTQ